MINPVGCNHVEILTFHKKFNYFCGLLLSLVQRVIISSEVMECKKLCKFQKLYRISYSSPKHGVSIRVLGMIVVTMSKFFDLLQEEDITRIGY